MENSIKLDLDIRKDVSKRELAALVIQFLEIIVEVQKRPSGYSPTREVKNLEEYSVSVQRLKELTEELTPLFPKAL